MPLRTRLLDFRTSRGPTAIGTCQSDLSGCAAAVNAAQQKLTYSVEQGDTGWYGSWVKMVFNVDTTCNPFITTPREVARLENIAVCKRPVPIQNQFFEFLDYGIGPQPRNRRGQNWLQGYERGTFPTFSDLVAGSTLRVYLTNAADAGKRVLVQGTDQNDDTIYSADGLVEVTGEFLVLTAPFIDSQILNSLTGLQKDVTIGVVRFYEVDTDGNERLILTMQPGETTAAYRRYQIVGMPKKCCIPCTSPLQIEAIAKLEYIPVAVDTDYLVPVGNLEAIIEECISIRYSIMDNPGAAQLAIKHHRDAIRLLNGELIHYEGALRLAVSFKPFGSADLARVNINMQ